MKKNIFSLLILTVIIFTVGCKDKYTANAIESHEMENENNIELTDAQLAQTKITIGNSWGSKWKVTGSTWPRRSFHAHAQER